MLHILIELVTACIVFDQPPIDIECFRVEVIGGVPVDSPMIAQDGRTSGNEKSFLLQREQPFVSVLTRKTGNNSHVYTYPDDVFRSPMLETYR